MRGMMRKLKYWILVICKNYRRFIILIFNNLKINNYKNQNKNNNNNEFLNLNKNIFI